MIILLVLLPALVSGARESVDWKNCALDTGCYCGDANDPPKLVQRIDDGQDCDKVGVQSQFFTDSYALFQMQLTVIPTDPVLSGSANPRIMLIYGSKKLFGCEYDRKDEKVILSGEKNFFFDYKIKLFEEKFRERSYLEAGNVVCAVTVGRYSKFKQKIIDTEAALATSSKKLSIMWTAGDSDANSKNFESILHGTNLFNTIGQIKCNPAFKDLLYSQDYYVEPIRNKDRYSLNCANYGTSYTMRYKKGGIVEEMTELKCTLKGNSYSYTIDTGKKDANTNSPNEIEVPDPESYSIFCTTPFEELCINPNKCTKATDPNCPDYVPGSKGKAAILTCPDNKWKIKDELYELDEQPACKRNTILDANGASFEAVLPSGQRVSITKDLDARCFTDWDCKKKSNLNIPSGSVIIDNGIMKCNDTEATMIVYHYETNTTLTGAKSYKCNPATGEFFNEANQTEKVLTYSRVSCRVNKTKFSTTEASITREQVIGIIVGVALLLLAIVIAGVVGGFCCWRHRNDVSIRNLKNMKREALAEKCKKDFRNISKAGPSNAYLIVDGLTLIDKMLEVELDDPKAWEEAGKFLTRVHGSIMRTDFQVWHMLSRYCHMQAGKIIDKYGWRTDTPITKDNPTGLIRAVAVQLLAFCLNDHPNYLAEEQIERGFGKLGFRGASQYPHAGVLWSIVPHARRGRYLRFSKRPHLLVNGFRTEEFCKVTREIACKKIPIAIPDADVIPEFGTVAEQAAYALGGVPRHTYLVSNTSGVLFGNESLPAVCAPTAYLRGMCESRGRDPAQIVLETCQMWPNFNEEFLAKMNLLAPEPVWHAVWRDAFQLLAMYGRDLDIRRMHSRFMPKDKSTDFFEIQREQLNFEKAIDSALEDIRKWLAKHTDKDELKKKWITTAPKVKLCERLFATGATTGGCSTSDKSSGGGKSSGGSKSAAVAAGTPVAAGTAAAAAPAAPAAGSPGAAAAPTAEPPIASPASPAAAMPTAPITQTPTA